jgi:Dyp-type peroxidase family
MTQLNLDNIQGNSIGGFNKDFQTLLFLKFKAAAAARTWIKEITNADLGVANSSSAQVLRFNSQFKALTAQGIQPETVISASWVNLALSAKGLLALGIAPAQLGQMSAAFAQGMTARSAILGDTGPSAPAKWHAPFKQPADVHALLLVASDSETELHAQVKQITKTGAFVAGAEVLHAPVQGRTRPDQVGHEHFGFKDGVSQPGIRGVDLPDDPVGNPDQGHPGQDLLWPGEFVLGYPAQIGTANSNGVHPNPDPGTVVTPQPSWTADGSYLVFRRLAQDVPGFPEHVATLAKTAQTSVDLMGAKLVGRYRSGCPIETLAFAAADGAPSNADPAIKIPALADSDTLNNDFEFEDDADGAICPLGAHIRKAYPRDEDTGLGAASEDDTQKHRLLRRGIPFGASFGSFPGGGAGDPRGLLFLCYQADLENQFEFVQSKWVAAPQFPPVPAGSTAAGEDPIIAQSASGPFALKPGSPAIQVNHFVTMTGGEYFFSPSISALNGIADGSIA